MSEQCCLVDGACSRLLCVLSLMGTGHRIQDNPYPSQKRRLGSERLQGIFKVRQEVLSGTRTGRAFWVMVKPVISGHTEAGNERSQELGRWSVQEAER